MKLALLLPGYLDSPEYYHIQKFEDRLIQLGYTTEALDPCNLWETNNVEAYTVTNYISHIKETITKYSNKHLDEVILIGHSLGGAISIIAGEQFEQVTKIIALCPPWNISKSEIKWTNGFRLSRRDFPSKNSYRYFKIPYSFIEDARKYSVLDSVKRIHKPLMIFIALDDIVVSPEETQKIVVLANNPHVIFMENIGHDFRLSKAETEIVMLEIEKFL